MLKSQKRMITPMIKKLRDCILVAELVTRTKFGLTIFFCLIYIRFLGHGLIENKMLCNLLYISFGGN